MLPIQARNVLGTPLKTCSDDPVTGWYRDGCCNTGPGDVGLHTVCVSRTAEFLALARNAGNDLRTPLPQYGFPGLTARRSLVPVRRALDRGARRRLAPQVDLEACHISVLEFVDLALLKNFAMV